jgi:hypothetical protein
MTAARSKALAAHLRALSGREARPRPGSYSWPTLREEAERRFARGRSPGPTIAELRARHADGVARPPSVRTMRRWWSDRRWLQARPPPPQPHP